MAAPTKAAPPVPARKSTGAATCSARRYPTASGRQQNVKLQPLFPADSNLHPPGDRQTKAQAQTVFSGPQIQPDPTSFGGIQPSQPAVSTPLLPLTNPPQHVQSPRETRDEVLLIITIIIIIIDRIKLRDIRFKLNEHTKLLWLECFWQVSDGIFFLFSMHTCKFMPQPRQSTPCSACSVTCLYVASS